jgi:hypothetical protein
MDQNEFKRYLVQLTELNPRQRRKVHDTMRVTEEAQVVAENLKNEYTLIESILTASMINFKDGVKLMVFNTTVAKNA